MKKINKAFETWEDHDFFVAATQGVGMKGERRSKILAFEALKHLCMACISDDTIDHKHWLTETKKYLEKIYEQG